MAAPGAATAEGGNYEEMRQYRALARRIRSGDCVLVLGPGASTDPSEPDETPLTAKLAKQMRARLRSYREALRAIDSAIPLQPAAAHL